MNDRTRWNEKFRAGQGPDRVNARLQKYLHLLKRGRALDLAGGIGQNARLLADAGWGVVLADVSDEALARAPKQLARVQGDASALPFVANSFDTIVCTYFFEPRVDFASLLIRGGTLFFETYTLADAKYRPDFPATPHARSAGRGNPAHRFDPAHISTVFKGLDILLFEETDDGHRVFATLIAQVASV